MIKKKILFTSNIELPTYSKKSGSIEINLGGWISETITELNKTGRYEIAVAMRSISGSYKCMDILGVKYYSVPVKLLNKFDVKKKYVSRILNEFNPDILHIEGTEMPHSLRYLENWSGAHVVSIQGLVSGIGKYNLAEGRISEVPSKYNPRVWLALCALILNHILRFLPRIKYEKKIFQKTKNIIGRTMWDRAHSLSMNNDAKYFKCARILRMPFYESSWSIENIERNSIFIGHSMIPLKGIHVLLRAVHYLKLQGIDLKIKIPGTRPNSKNDIAGLVGFPYLVGKLIQQLDLHDNVEFLGSLNADKMSKYMSRSHIFVLSSLIENESITLAEAMTIGMPAICSYCGGIPSLFKDEEHLLFFRAGDYILLAHQIARIIENDDLAVDLSRRGRNHARLIYDKPKNITNLIDVYDKLI